MGVGLVRWARIVVVGSVVGAGCGGGGAPGGDADGAGGSVTETPSVLLASIEADGADPALLRTGTAGEVSLAVVDDGDEVVAYLCDGFAGEWFVGAEGDDLRSASGSVLQLGEGDARVTGGDGELVTIPLDAADGDDDLQRFVDEGGIGGLVMHDGVVRGTVRRGESIGTRPSPTTAPTTTAAPRVERFVSVTTIELGDVGRSTAQFDVPCAIATDEVERTYADLAVAIETMYGRLIAEARAAIEELQRGLGAIDDRVRALDDQLAGLDVEYNEVIQQLLAATDPVEIDELERRSDELVQARSSLQDERDAEVDARATSLLEVTVLDERIIELETDRDAALAALPASLAAALEEVARTCR